MRGFFMILPTVWRGPKPEPMRFGKHLARPPPAKEAVSKSAEPELVALQKEKELLKDEVQSLRAKTKRKESSRTRTVKETKQRKKKGRIRQA